MAKAILSNVADGIIGQLGRAAVKEIALLWGVEDELHQLQDTISTIQSVLVDAEKQQSRNNQVRNWLERLEDAVYEADDLVDELSTEALRRRVMSGNKMAKKVRTFFSTSNQLAFRHKMGSKIRDVRKKLDRVANDRKFHLETDLQDSKVVSREWETHSFIRKEDVVGRNDDKMTIMKLLFEMKIDQENIGVIPIVGVGGLGKTTLAQLVINDAMVQQQFELTMWVNVPKDFDVQVVVKEIVRSVKGERCADNVSMDQLQKDLREMINGKRYFLVLDDVWNESREKWLRLENLLRNGGEESRIIVTTRSKKVADIVGTIEHYVLGMLSDDKSWSLFKKVAFKQGQEPKDVKVVEIGKEITKKCGGIPLVIRTIGSMLYSINQQEWSFFKERELSKIPEYEDDILPRLKLSYDRLPSHLKHCFAYCRTFPKNTKIDVKNLINLWMAQGFIRFSYPDQHPEDMGYEYFKDLLWRSFFHEVEVDDFSNIKTCKMHDCMHDLSVSVAGTEGVILSSNDVDDDNKIDARTRHVSFSFALSSPLQFPASLVRSKRIRTILRPHKYFLPIHHVTTQKSIDELIDSSFQFLRTLDLGRGEIKIVPNSIGNLKHLRFLDLSHNEMEVLPNSITRLQNLQTLNLSFCVTLRALPEDITKLVNLRHLGIHCCSSLTHMPRGIGQLTNLQILSLFVLHEDSPHPCGQLNELENLNNLRGHLQIDVRKDSGIIETKSANLKKKEYLQSLELKIQGTIVDDCEGLLPHPNIKALTLSGSVSVGLLSCVPTLANLVKFSLHRDSKSQYLSPLNHLPQLKVLELIHLTALEYISSDIVDGNDFSFFPSLQQLWLRDIPNLKGWWKDVMINGENDEGDASTTTIPSFPHLSKLIIEQCPLLISMPLFPYLEDELSLENTSLKLFQQTIGMIQIVGGVCSSSSSHFLPLSKLTSLWIHNIEDLQCLPEWFKGLASLKVLTIRDCGKLQSLSPGIRHLTSLQELEIDDCHELHMPTSGSDAIFMWGRLERLRALIFTKLPKLVSLPEGLQQVTSLEKIHIWECHSLVGILECISNLKSLMILDISRCPKLMSLPEGIDCLTSLQNLSIKFCPILLERCKMDIGDYWPKICHINVLDLYPMPQGAVEEHNESQMRKKILPLPKLLGSTIVKKISSIHK